MKLVPRLIFSVAAVFALTASLTPSVAQITPLSANDVSWLFPAPTKLDDLISMGDLKSSHGNPIWSDDAFRRFLYIANGDAGRVLGTDQRISLPPEVGSKYAWYIAAVRFDPSAPGFSDDIRKQFGQELQIRLVVQPVTAKADGTLKVHDIAAHLIFEFNAGNAERKETGCFPRLRPDLPLAKQIAQELVDMRARVGETVTSGKPLGVHPGLASAATAGKVRQAMKELLERHLSARRLGLMTITAAIQKDVPDTWFFLATINLRVHPQIDPQSAKVFVAMPAPALDGHQYVEMLKPNELQNSVVPIPHANNNFKGRFAMTCRNAANRPPGPPLDQRIGYATADILDMPNPEERALRTVVDTIADPDRSHVFNTDCVSCHTETRVFQQFYKTHRHLAQLAGVDPDAIPGIDPSALPGDNRLNTRAFGWFPEHNDVDPDRTTVQPTVSRRTACETAKVTDYINGQLLGASAIAPIPSQQNGAECPNR